MTKNYTFLTRSEYFRTLVSEIDHAAGGTPVMICTMALNPDEPLVAAVIRALGRAARRGVRVTLLIDAYNFLTGPRSQVGPLFYRRSIGHPNGVFARIAEALHHIESCGGVTRTLNMPVRRFRPYMFGRSHIKGAIIGNRVFVGGCNLERSSFIDVMVSWEDGSTARILTGWFERIAASGTVRRAFSDVDIVARLDDTSELLLDAGVPGQSIIYDEALQLIDEAGQWLRITCQYFPGGMTAQRLAAAQARGVQVEIDYSHPRAHGTGAPLQYLHQLHQRTRRLPRNFFAGRLDRQAPKLHAKILMSEQTALVGSHNFVPQGVQLGTAEVAMRSTDKDFISGLAAFIRGQLAAASPQPNTPPARSTVHH